MHTARDFPTRKLAKKYRGIISPPLKSSMAKVLETLDYLYTTKKMMADHFAAPSPRTPDGMYICTPPETSSKTYLLQNLPWFGCFIYLGCRGAPVIAHVRFKQPTD